MQFWSPHLAKDIAKLEAVQHRATEIIPPWHNKLYEERLAQLNLSAKILKGFTNVDANRLFVIDDSSRTRSKGVKLRCKQLHLDRTKFFFTNDIVREWSKFPPSMVQCNMTNSFKNKLDHYLLQQGFQ